MKTYKILVPKPAAVNEEGTEVGLYAADDMITPKGEWQQNIMDGFVENGWAMEVKAIQPEETVTIEAEVSVTEEKAEPEAEAEPTTEFSVSAPTITKNQVLIHVCDEVRKKT